MSNDIEASWQSICSGRTDVLHTMAVLQAYRADLLKDLDQGKGLSPVVSELHMATDLALRATKQVAS